jgi:hypothetical protein
MMILIMYLEWNGKMIFEWGVLADGEGSGHEIFKVLPLHGLKESAKTLFITAYLQFYVWTQALPHQERICGNVSIAPLITWARYGSGWSCSRPGSLTHVGLRASLGYFGGWKSLAATGNLATIPRLSICSLVTNRLNAPGLNMTSSNKQKGAKLLQLTVLFGVNLWVVRFEILKAVWRLFVWVYLENGGSRFLRNVGTI